MFIKKDSIPQHIQEDLKLFYHPEDFTLVANTLEVQAAMDAYRDSLSTRPMRILVDMRTLCYPLLTAYKDFLANQAPFPQAPRLLYTDLLAMWERKLASIPDDLIKLATQDQGPNPLFDVVIVDDYPASYPGFEKPVYWRHIPCPEYKAGRASKPDEWDTLTSTAYDAACTLGYPVVRQPYFEADDIIAQQVRDRGDSYSRVVIWTVDTDLLQLVTDDQPSPVTWYNDPYPPFVRDQPVTLAYWAKRWKHTLGHPKEIAAYKAKHGDKSDNLAPGSPIGLIDLWEPLESPQPVAIPTTPQSLKTLTTKAQRALLASLRLGLP